MDYINANLGRQRKLKNDCQKFEAVHKYWGKQMYCQDVDMIEYNARAEPKVMIEMKFGLEKKIDLTNWQFKCHINTADRLNIPLYCVVYYPPGEDEVNGTVDQFGSYWQFYVIPANAIAKGLLSEPTQFSEYEYVKFMYMNRGERMPEELTLDNHLTSVPLPAVVNV